MARRQLDLLTRGAHCRIGVLHLRVLGEEVRGHRALVLRRAGEQIGLRLVAQRHAGLTEQRLHLGGLYRLGGLLLLLKMGEGLLLLVMLELLLLLLQEVLLVLLLLLGRYSGLEIIHDRGVQAVVGRRAGGEEAAVLLVERLPVVLALGRDAWDDRPGRRDGGRQRRRRRRRRGWQHGGGRGERGGARVGVGKREGSGGGVERQLIVRHIMHR